MGIPQVYSPNKRIIRLITLTPRPVFIMSCTVRWPYEKTMALGGLATGNRKAQEALIVAGIMIRRGFIPIPSASEVRIG